MSEYRRAFSPGGTFFFTLVTYRRRLLFESAANVDLLRSVFRVVRDERTFELDAAIILPDHLHLLMTLPSGDNDFSWRLGRVKATFSKLVNQGRGLNERREADIWQRRFWEHLIQDEDDFNEHLNYIHYNPVKHGLARCPHEWPYSSFMSWVNRGIYEADWCCSCGDRKVVRPYRDRLDDETGE